MKLRGARSNILAPAMTIQRFWRGTRAALRIMRWDNAAAKIQHSYKVYRWNLRADRLLQATLRIQRCWLGAIHRKWLRHCHASATYIQKMVRATCVRLAPDREGREIARHYQTLMNAKLKQKDTMTETGYIALTAAIGGRLRS